MRPSGRARVLLSAALGPIITGFAVVASLLVLVVALAPRSEFSTGGVLAAACPAWLAAYQVPLDIEGAPLGVLPLLPTFAALFLVFRTAAAALRRLEDLDGPTGTLSRSVSVVGGIAGAHALFSVALVAVSATPSIEGELPEAIVLPTVLAAVAAALGAASTAAKASGAATSWDPVAVRGIRTGVLAFGALFVLGTLAFLLATLIEGATFGELFSGYSPDVGSGAGMLLLSLGYLPNLSVLASSVLTGGGFSVGEVSVSAWELTPGPVPAVPMLAGLPAEYGAWWPLLLVVPVAVGAGVGWSLRTVDERLQPRLRAVLAAGIGCGFCALVLAALAGGALGGGPFSPVRVHAEVYSLCAFAFVVGPGAVVVWRTGANGRAGSRRSRRRTPRRGRERAGS